MLDTTTMLISGARMMLGRPSDIILPFEDMRELLNDQVRGFIQDLNLSPRPQREETKQVQIDEDETDYILTMADVPDFEPVRLEFSVNNRSTNVSWGKVTLLSSGDAFSSLFDGPGTVGYIYGDQSIQGGIKVKLNLSADAVDSRQWRLTYRVPLLVSLQEDAPVPLPSNFSRFVKLRLALAAGALLLLQSDSPALTKVLSGYATECLEWDNSTGEGRWNLYLSRSLQSPIQPYKRYDDFRRRARSVIRPFLPVQ